MPRWATVSEPTRLTKADIHRLFELLDAELGAEDIEGEIYLVGGAVMCLQEAVEAAKADGPAEQCVEGGVVVIGQGIAMVGTAPAMSWPAPAASLSCSPTPDSANAG